jgi:hypothetical protein
MQRNLRNIATALIEGSMSVIAFHEKAGRCQALFAFLISIFSFLPSGFWAERPGAVKGALCAA